MQSWRKFCIVVIQTSNFSLLSSIILFGCQRSDTKSVLMGGLSLFFMI